jgi:hypothetical protein
MGSFVCYPQEDRGELDSKILALFGQLPNAGLTLQAALSTLLHPDDRARYNRVVERATAPDGEGTPREDVGVPRHKNANG